MKSRARRRDRHPLFDQPNAQADFGYCAKLDYWTPEEGAALSLGYAPRFVSSKTVEPYLKVSSKADEFDRRLVLILRAVDANSLKQQFTPADLADRVRLEFPKKLRKAITTIGASPTQASQEHHRAPQGSSGIIVGVAAMANVFGRSQRTMWRWIRDHNFPAATLPSGHVCTSLSLIDAWLLGRLQDNRPNRPGTFEARAGEVGGDVPGSDRPMSRQS